MKIQPRIALTRFNGDRCKKYHIHYHSQEPLSIVLKGNVLKGNKFLASQRNTGCMLADFFAKASTDGSGSYGLRAYHVQLLGIHDRLS